MEVVKDIENKEQVRQTEENLIVEEQPIAKKIVYEPYKSDIERAMAIAEANLLCNMINTSYFYLHFSNPVVNKKGDVIEQGKITKSTQISCFEGKELQSMINRVAEINNRLMADIKESK